LGGDSFGYHWIDDDHFAVYLLDVSGHGWGAALLSVSVINVLGAALL
jgi:sigma-B regulation protein RsbU (phosphoserine phosphatase)